MQGKIIKQTELLGFIEYDIDKRISFTVLDIHEFNVGDVVSFDIGTKRINNSTAEFEVAVNINLVRKKKNLTEKVFRINKVAKSFNCSISAIVEILKNNGFDVESIPNTKIYEEQILILENHFIQLENDLKKKEQNLTIERGTVFTSIVTDIIYPSLIVLEFFDGKKALLPLNNLSWNKSRSEKILQSTNKGDELKVVVLEVDSPSPLVSRKHLIPRPNETELWNEIEMDSALNGRVIEVLINKAVIELENGFFGLIDLPLEAKLEIGHEFNFNIVSKNDNSLYLGLTLNTEVNASNQDSIELPIIDKKLDLVRGELSSKSVTSRFASIESELQSIEKFNESIYFNFCDDDQEEFISQAFSLNPYLFACSISVDYPLCIQFGMNLLSWESDFKNKLIPYLTKGEDQISEKEALEALAQEKYWFRINRYVKNEVEKIGWVLFNEEFFLSGFVDEDNNNFIVLSLSIQRTQKNKSNQKTRSLSEGTFLYDSKITFISPFQNKPLESNQKEIFKLLDDKTKAFGIISKLKEESGALLLEEGLSLQIFDRFLEFQESLLKKGNTINRVWTEEKFRRISSDLGQLSIQLQVDLIDLCNDDCGSTLVTIRTLKSSTKKTRDEEFVFFSDALLEVSIHGSKLHFNSDDISLEDLEKGFYIEPKISLRQFQVQREVLQDFFSKKIKLEHIESLLLKPEKIQPPKLVATEFFNQRLTETELNNPNNNQVNSVKKSIGNKNIFLVQGPPGTGKTTVIAEIVQQLAKNNEKILVTSQTHVAVDNVLEKVSEVKDLSLLRLGNIQRVKTDLRKYHKEKQIETYSEYFSDSIRLNVSLTNQFIASKGILSKDELIEIVYKEHNYPEEIESDLILKNIEFIDSLLELKFENVLELPEALNGWIKSISSEQDSLILPLIYSTLDVVFATCIGVRTDRDLSDYNVVFDTVIIDEAGKANLSESIAAISMAKKIILVGDQMQLPPYIDGSLLDSNEKTSFPNSKFGNKFLDKDIQHALRTSFFEFLVNRISSGNFPNANIEMLNYQHRMHPDIGQFISDAFYGGQVKMGERTIENVLPLPSPFDKQVVFLDTSTAENPFEIKEGISFKNDTEAQCISQLVVPHLLKSGLSSQDFAIVAPYKSQVANIKQHLLAADASLNSQIDVSTLDSFQGMEFDVIIFSFTRSARDTKVGFLDDARRLNVAFSRAKKKLILIGNSDTLTDKRSHYDQLFNYTQLFNKLVELSKDEKLGNFVNVTDFTNLKSGFQSQIEKFKVGNSYNCQPKVTFEKPNFNGHIFYIEGSTLEGMFRDDDKVLEFDKDLAYRLFITEIDFKNERIYLSPKQSLKSVFFIEKKVGDKVMARYKLSIDAGHFFEIEFGFDCFLYDPSKSKKFTLGEECELFIIKLDHKERKVSVSDSERVIQKPNSPAKKERYKNDRKPKSASFQREANKLKFFNTYREGDTIKAHYTNSTDFGHFFELLNGFNGLFYDPKKVHDEFIEGKAYELEITKMDNRTGKVSLGLKKR